MLRPATPLTLLLFGAFGLLVVSIISTPIVRFIPLASFAGINFGVFGFCKANNCSPIKVGYDTSSLFNDAQSSTFDLPSSTRATLSTILILHPLAALLTLFMLVLAASAHFHAPSHSPRYLLIIFILSILTLLAALLSFLIDVLLFVPHMAWGSYSVLAATILIGVSGIISCAMRRTLVSRKARKRRIAENSEMNGESFYNQIGPDPQLSSNGIITDPGIWNQNKPEFASFNVSKKEKDLEITTDERIPLTQQKATDIPTSDGAQIGMIRTNGVQIENQNGLSLPKSTIGPNGSRNQNPSDPSTRRTNPELYMSNWNEGNTSFPKQPYNDHYRGRNGYGYQRGGRGNYGPPRGSYQSPIRFDEQLLNPREYHQGPPRKASATRNFRGRGGAPQTYGGQIPSVDEIDLPLPPFVNRPIAQDHAQYTPYSTITTSDYSTYNPEDVRGSFPVAETPPPFPVGMDGPHMDEFNHYKGMESLSDSELRWGSLAPSSYYEESRLNTNTPPLSIAPIAPHPIKLVSGTGIGISLERDVIPDNYLAGPTSPVDSETSNFTSISQRGINPIWNGENNNAPPTRTMFQRKIEKEQQQDIIFRANPDFTLPTGRGGRGVPRGRGIPRGGRIRRGESTPRGRGASRGVAAPRGVAMPRAVDREMSDMTYS